MNILKRPNSKGDKIIFYYDFGRGAGQRPSIGIFIYKNPKDQLQKNHNKQALTLHAFSSFFVSGHNFDTNCL